MQSEKAETTTITEQTNVSETTHNNNIKGKKFHKTMSKRERSFGKTRSVKATKYSAIQNKATKCST